MTGVDPISWAMIAMSATKALGTIAQGHNADEIAKFQAKQMRQIANREEALSQREAIEERRAARLLGSRAIAMAGASGAGVDDPTVSNILGEIDARGEYNALMALYNGTMKARDLRTDADAKREEGRAAKRNAYLTSIVDLGTSLYDQGAFTNSGLFGMKGAATASRSNLIQPITLPNYRRP